MEPKDIELRSERVRYVIGRIPPILIRGGITFISILIFSLIAAAWFIPYPENLNIEIEVKSEREAMSLVKYKYVDLLKEEMPVEIILEGYDSRIYGYIKGSIQSINNDIIQKDGQNYFVIVIRVHSQTNIMKDKMKGEGFILLSNESVLKKIKNKLFYSIQIMMK
jgi:hypothetical protein